MSKKTATDEEEFYARLPALEDFLDVTDPARYREVPGSWSLVITDVVGSTRAIEAGRYREVNALGVASIIAVKNAQPDLDIPFVFGGDGATLLVPSSRRERTESALRGARSLARNSFGLDLRTSIVSIQELREAGHQARVARFKASPEAEFAMFAGHAYAVAEAWVKDPTTGPTFQVSEAGDNEVDFEGFECRWKPLRTRRGNTLSLLVLARATAESDRVGTYRRILEAIEAIVDLESSLPVKAVQLALNGPMADFSIEARVRSQRRAGPEFRQAAARARKATVIGKALTLLGVRAGDFDGRQYRAEVARNTDFRKFDGTLRMVLDLSDAELAELRELLAKEHAAGRIVYGVHRASAALITCFVRSYRGDHLHFVDGADGGYALAAKQLKAQLAEIG